MLSAVNIAVKRVFLFAIIYKDYLYCWRKKGGKDIVAKIICIMCLQTPYLPPRSAWRTLFSRRYCDPPYRCYNSVVRLYEDYYTTFG